MANNNARTHKNVKNSIEFRSVDAIGMAQTKR